MPPDPLCLRTKQEDASGCISMSEPVFYMRGIPSLGTQPVEKGIVDDLLIVGGLGEDLIERLFESLRAAKGFLDPTRLFALITKEIQDSKAARAVYHALIFLRADGLEEFLERVDEWRKGNQGQVSEESFLSIKRALKRIVKPYSALERYRKAERLEKVTGQALEDVQLICDLRPIFDERREVIEGMIPYTRLRIVAEGADGLPIATEIELTQRQVGELAGKAESALKKLRTLRQQAEDWIPGGVPELSRTMSADRENGND